jgi:hypothetical protein
MPQLSRTDQIYLISNSIVDQASYLSDLRTNCIRVQQLSSVAAIRLNGEMLGISFSRLCDPETISPLYSPGERAGTAMCAQTFHHTSPDLRPIAAQRRHSHHPWIDTMPSPTLRHRLLECLSTDPPLVDEDDFCGDLKDGGLICWGSTRSPVNTAYGSGAPWDVRSWEAQPWFLQKWWFLLGGKEGELFQTSKWWREMRGERLQYPWQGSVEPIST